MASDQDTPRAAGPSVLALSLLAVFLGLTAGGYLTFRVFASGSLADAANLYAVAAVAAIAGFFSPCSFPLLPAYVALFHTDRGGGRIVLTALAAALGALAFAVLLGAAVGVGGTAIGAALSVTATRPSLGVTVLRTLVSGVLLAFGIVQLSGRGIASRLGERVVSLAGGPRKRTRFWSMFGYGFGYVLAGTGCTGPILAGLVVLGVGSGTVAASWNGFFVFALTIFSLMFTVSLIAAGSRAIVGPSLYRILPHVRRVAAVVMMAAAVFNLASTFELIPPRTLFPS